MSTTRRSISRSGGIAWANLRGAGRKSFGGRRVDSSEFFAPCGVSVHVHDGASAVEPRGHEPPAVVIAEIRSIVLQRALPDRHVDARRRMHVVLLRGQIAL